LKTAADTHPHGLSSSAENGRAHFNFPDHGSCAGK
jgi:hypothetical protein